MSKIEFGADGIRYIAGELPLDPPTAFKIGRALGQFLCARDDHPVLVLGRDTRPSGGWLASNLTEGLLQEGINVIGLDIMTTPGVAYLTRRLGANLGLSVSASHNPVEYNGLKLVGPDGLRLQREEEIEIEQQINRSSFPEESSSSRQGQAADSIHLVELYIEEHVQRCPAHELTGLTVVLDCANGAAARVAPAVFRRLGANVQVINAEADGIINHKCGSEYVRRHPEQFVYAIRQQEADYGLACDGDGDRLVVVDSAGYLFDGDDILFALADYYRSQGLLRGNAIVTTRMANSGLIEALQALGVVSISANKGDKALEAAMWRGNFILGGEQTGNIIINDGHHAASDAIFTALVLMGSLYLRGLSLRQTVEPLQKHPQIVASCRVTTAKPLAEITPLRDQLRHSENALGPSTRIIAWYSSTEPGLFRTMVEGGQGSTVEQTRIEAQAICQVMQKASGLHGTHSILDVSTRKRVS